jgi:hypothetical protein
MNDQTNSNPTEQLTKANYVTQVTRLVASVRGILVNLPADDHERTIVWLHRLDDNVARAMRGIGPPQGNPKSVLAALTDLSALQREIEIEISAREHCIFGGIEDLEAARQCAADNHDARMGWSDVRLAEYWATVPVPRPTAPRRQRSP